MEKRQRAIPYLKGICLEADKGREAGRKLSGHHGHGQHSHDLTRLRIERNKAARHARCAVIFK